MAGDSDWNAHLLLQATTLVVQVPLCAIVTLKPVLRCQKQRNTPRRNRQFVHYMGLKLNLMPLDGLASIKPFSGGLPLKLQWLNSSCDRDTNMCHSSFRWAESCLHWEFVQVKLLIDQVTPCYTSTPCRRFNRMLKHVTYLDCLLMHSIQVLYTFFK